MKRKTRLTLLTSFLLGATAAATAQTIVGPEKVLVNLKQTRITGYAPPGCVRKSTTIKILGTNFGNKQGTSRVVFLVDESTVPLQVKSWKDGEIGVAVSNNSKLVPGRSYAIALQSKGGGVIAQGAAVAFSAGGRTRH